MYIKKIIINGLIIGSISLSGCAGYYESQTAYYTAQTRSAEAYLRASQQPIAEMVAPDGTRFVVNQVAIQMPVIKESNNPMVEGIKTIVNSTPASILSGAVLAGEILKNSVGSTSNTTNTDGSNNQSTNTTSTSSSTNETQSTNDNHSVTTTTSNSNNPSSTDNHTSTNTTDNTLPVSTSN